MQTAVFMPLPGVQGKVMLRSLSRRLRTGLLSSLLGCAAIADAAIGISITDPSPTMLATKAACKGYIDGKDYKDCSSTASLSTTAIGGSDAEFKKSFDAWNSALPAASKWTLVDAGLLPGGSLKVSTFDAYLGTAVGGVEINVIWEFTPPAGDPAKDLWSWAQGLNDNYTISPPAFVPPFYEMDNAGSTATPLYPFQYPDRHFYDKPAAPLPTGSFSARAMLVRVDTTFRTLTAYEGLSYGFTLAAVQAIPEPGTLVLWLAGLAGVGWRLGRDRT